ncbi:hypothetical protein Plhal703r1_c05g0026281 [Plasmopara halstedii]
MRITRSIFLLVCSISASDYSFGTQEVAAATDPGAARDASGSAPNVSSLHEIRTENVESRSGRFSSLIKMSNMVKNIGKGSTRIKYDEYVMRVLLYDDLENALISPDMETFYNFCLKQNRDKKSKRLLSPIVPFLKKYGHNNVLDKLRGLAEREDYKQLMMKHLLQIQREVWVSKGMSINNVLDLLQFGDDLASAIRIERFDELKEYIILLGLKKYRNEALPSDYADNKLVNILTKHFGGEGNLVKQLSKAKSFVENANVVNNLESALFRIWLNVPVDLVWDRLRVGNNVYDALTSGKLEIVRRYFAHFFPSRPYLAIQEFLEQFGYDKVTVALAIAKLEPVTKEFATTMQRELLGYWKEEEISANVIVTRMKFKEDDDINISIIKLNTISHFIILLQPEPQLVKADNLWDLARLAAIALKGSYDPAKLKSGATRLLDAIFDVWSDRNVQPHELLTHFPIDEKANSVTTNDFIVLEYEKYREAEYLSIRPYEHPR